MGRFEPTSRVEVPGLEHSVAELPWGVLRGAHGPSDGSAGALSNVPSALAVLRHAPLYAAYPDEIEEAFEVLERHAIRHRLLYPVAVTIAPFLLDFIRRGNPLSSRIAEVIAEYAAAAMTLEEDQCERLLDLLALHEREVLGWMGTHDRALAALAIHVPALRAPYLAKLAEATTVSPFALLALIELGSAPGKTELLALEMLDDKSQHEVARGAAAAFLAHHASALTPALRERIDAALTPAMPATLANLVTRLWEPTIVRPVVAPKLHEAEVVFAGEKLVLVKAGARTVTLPWVNAPVAKGDVLKVGITTHGKPKLALLTDTDGRVTIVDF
ncbi:MAG: hypothetical protein JNL83_18510 [Myxococcales bacterium]|nr:hypothetical protein [Myxococcales bacterium]